MKIQELMNLYIEQAKICFETNYDDKNSVNANNKAVYNMYKIIDTLNTKFSINELEEFFIILKNNEYGANLWAAIHLLEKVKLPQKIKSKALEIIKNEIKTNESNAFGLQLWLDDWTKSN